MDYWYLVFLFATGAYLQAAFGAPKDGACPPAEQIDPCLCKMNATLLTLTMDCSAVVSNEQLKDIFWSQPEFPFKKFTKFFMDSNHQVTVLLNAVFNDIKFVEIEAINGVLKEITQGSVEESKETLEKLILHDNQIDRFLMIDTPDMSMFTKLEYLHLGGNQIQVFPDIKSNYIKKLYLNDNPITTIHNENLIRVPNLELIEISEDRMNILETALLKNHRKLKRIFLGRNNLKEIPEDALVTQSSNLTEIDLSNNRIDDVEPGAFDKKADLTLNFENNELVHLAEDTWKPLIKAGVHLNFEGNPLECGCDIKWAKWPVPDVANGDTNYTAFMEGHCPLFGEDMTIANIPPEWFDNFCE